MNPTITLETALVTIDGGASEFLTYAMPGHAPLRLAAPCWWLDGRAVAGEVAAWRELARERLPNGCTSATLAGELTQAPGHRLEVELRWAEDDPVVRLRCTLHGPGRLGKPDGCDRLRFTACAGEGVRRHTLIELSAYDETIHSYRPQERELLPATAAMGPLLALERDGSTALLAYEHGSQSNEAFLAFRRDGGDGVALEAVQGTYCAGDALPWRSPWLEVAVVSGGRDELAVAYRRFVLEHLALHPATRRPILCYNTWNQQERAKAWHGRPYLADMTEERMLAEIDVAAGMGIDAFVLDTGWYDKTGDWRASRERFPRGLRPIRERLALHGMRLGLWFGPLHAAVSSQARQAHEDCLMTTDGRPGRPHPIWETEASQNLCLVSRWGAAFADELIRLHREKGVTVFKWDAIGQSGCDDPNHGHGGPEATRAERAARYAYLLPLAMQEIVERLAAAVPEAIVDFDVTEGGRAVGLAFLAAGRYFLVNNGPYFGNYDLPPGADGNWNLFFRPGPARSWICRQTYDYDRWIPAQLMLVHYLPDDTGPLPAHGWLPANHGSDNLEISLASLMLGHDGVWGDLVGLPPAAVQRWGAAIARWKQVRDAIGRAHPRCIGRPGMSPEIHEKLHHGRGCVAIFAAQRGSFVHITAQPVEAAAWSMPSPGGSLSIERLTDGRARLTAVFTEPGARLALFGTAG